MFFVIQRIKNEIELFVKKIKWKKNNTHNFTNIRNSFPIEHVSVGKGTYGGIKVIDYGDGMQGRLKIGHYCSIADGVVFILAGEHDMKTFSTYPWGCYYWGESERQAMSRGDIIVEDDVWIGLGAIILSGVRIGRGAVVAAGSVVTHDIEAYTVVGGVPAKCIKERFPREIVQKLSLIDFEKLDPDELFKIKKVAECEVSADNVDYILERVRMASEKI